MGRGLIAAVLAANVVACTSFSASPDPPDPSEAPSDSSAQPTPPNAWFSPSNRVGASVPDACKGAQFCDDFDNGQKNWGGVTHHPELISTTGGTMGVAASAGPDPFDVALNYQTVVQYPKHIDLRFDVNAASCNPCLLARVLQLKSGAVSSAYYVGIDENRHVIAGDWNWALTDTGLVVPKTDWHTITLLLDGDTSLVTLDGKQQTNDPGWPTWENGQRMNVLLGVFHQGPAEPIDVRYDNVFLTVSE